MSSVRLGKRGLALALVVSMLAVPLTAFATGGDPGPVRVESRLDVGRPGADSTLPSLVGDAPPAAAGSAAVADGPSLGPGGPLDIDDPGAPFGYPNDNTYGYTTKSADLDTWKSDISGGIEVQVDMGRMARKAQISSEKDYILELDFTMVSYHWFDADGVFDPLPGKNSRGVGDDPCPEEPFKLFTVHLNGKKIRTVEGHNTQPCAPGGPESAWTFEVKTVGDDPPYWVRLPKDAVKEGKNTVVFEVHDFVLPAYMPYHSKTSDGWHMYMWSAVIELAAPPLVLSHGWSNAWAPANQVVGWQPTFKSNIKSEMTSHFGQDPWRWARIAGKDAILLNHYNTKQDYRKSASELAANVANHHSNLGFNGKGWIHGHSMGGLVTRYYVEALGGSAKIERLAQTGTPNLGSWEADTYTWWFRYRFEAADEDYTMKYYIDFETGLPTYIGWRDWWSPSIWAWEWKNGPGHGDEHLADFELKDPSKNPITAGLNARFPAGGVRYFSVRGDCNVFTSGSCSLSGFWWRGDGAVGLDSATMNGAIPHRTIDAFHEDIPAQTHTARWMIRFWTELDLDNGKPALGSAIAPPPLLDTPAGVADAADATSASDAPTATEMAYVVLRATDVALGPFEHAVALDAAPTAAIAVLSSPFEGPIAVTLRSPSGALIEPTTPGVTYADTTTEFSRVRSFEIPAPEPGEWTVVVQPNDLPPIEGIPLVIAGFVASEIEVTAASAASRWREGETATILARATDAGAPLPGLTIVARSESEKGPFEVALLDDGAHNDGAAGDGLYGGQWTTGEAGTQRFDVVATGAGVRRAATAEVVVASLPDLAVASPVGAPATAWAGDDVTISVDVTSMGERDARGVTTATFYDGDPALGGAVLGVAETSEPIALGATRTLAIATRAPARALDVHVLVASTDVESSLANNAASALMPFEPSPRTVATIAGEAGANGWMLGEATVTIGAFDGSAGATASTWTSLDGAPAVPYAGPIVLAAEGDHALRYWSVSHAGVVEPAREARVKIDLAAPSGALLNPSTGNAHVATVAQANPAGFTAVAGLVDVALDAADTGAGVARVAIALDGEAHGVAALAEDGRYHLLWDSTKASVGNHVLSWTIEDGAGRSIGGEQGVYVVVGREVEVEKDPAALVARLDPREG